LAVDNFDEQVSFYELEWDTQYFGITCAKAVLHKPLSNEVWSELLSRVMLYDFVSVENRDSNPHNALLIGENTNAFLADVNIQLEKGALDQQLCPQEVKIIGSQEPDERIASLSYFPFSKFIEDSRLATRGGAQVYRHWVVNSFDKPHKHFALAEGSEGRLDGFVLYRFEGGHCWIELIVVAPHAKGNGVGTKLFEAVEYAAYHAGCTVRVGTQVHNHSAINFYHKMGCRQVGCHQVYHVWKSEIRER